MAEETGPVFSIKAITEDAPRGKKEELIAALESLNEGVSDIEERHIRADALLLEYIGDEEVKRAFESLNLAYA